MGGQQYHVDDVIVLNGRGDKEEKHDTRGQYMYKHKETGEIFAGSMMAEDTIVRQEKFEPKVDN